MADQLDSALLALQNGEKEQARLILANLLRVDPKNELAWYWLATCVDSVQQQLDCLMRAIALNPANSQAQAALVKLDQAAPPPNNKPEAVLPTDPQTNPEPYQPSSHINAPDVQRKKSGVSRGELWAAIGTLIVLTSCIVLSLTGVYIVANLRSDFPASDPVQFKKATGKYQLIEVFADW